MVLGILIGLIFVLIIVLVGRTSLLFPPTGVPQERNPKPEHAKEVHEERTELIEE